jgi:SAM-dependent methyltransferase
MDREKPVRTPGSLQLYDKGEEAWNLRIHVGCGNIYLDGYINADAQGELAKSRPDLVEANLTTIDDYYGRKVAYTDIHNIPPRGMNVVDILDDMLHFEMPPKSVDKIVCVQTLEHVNPDTGEELVAKWSQALRYQGVLILSVPDTAATVEILLNETTRGFAIQHLAGTRKDEYSYHHNWYTHHSLEMLLNLHGFITGFLPNFHKYPAIVVRGVRM